MSPFSVRPERSRRAKDERIPRVPTDFIRVLRAFVPFVVIIFHPNQRTQVKPYSAV